MAPPLEVFVAVQAPIPELKFSVKILTLETTPPDATKGIPGPCGHISVPEGVVMVIGVGTSLATYVNDAEFVLNAPPV